MKLFKKKKKPEPELTPTACRWCHQVFRDRQYVPVLRPDVEGCPECVKSAITQVVLDYIQLMKLKESVDYKKNDC